MGNTDILTTSLPDADTENTTEHSTIFDDVFRTIAQKNGDDKNDRYRKISEICYL